MPHFLTRGLRVTLDFAVLSLAFWAAFLFRFEFSIPSGWAHVAFVTGPFVVGFEYGVLALFGVHQFSWRYMSMRETVQLGLAMVVSTTALVAFRIAFGGADHLLGVVIIPLGVLASNFFLSLVLLLGVRATRRLYSEAKQRKLRSAGGDRARVLLIGAGQAGVLVARELQARPDLRLDPVGFVDDDPYKRGTRIAGLPVLGKTDALTEIAARKRVKHVLITIANASGESIRRITALCRDGNLETKIIPGIHEILDERVNLSKLREVAIEDLLGREPVRLDEDQISQSIHGAVVIVTGAGGSIGSELCRQVCRFRPARLVLVERFENALFEIHRELLASFPDVTLVPLVADICDARRMEQIFAEQSPTVAFHAAAHKHVPMMEANPGEAVKNNIGGTRVVADLAHRFGVERFVTISTDKAVNPTSVMGATKRVAEIYTQALARRSKTRFVTVRFGNVLGSNGSVIPIFKQQIAAGGPVTVTDPKMTRYFMTIPEASQLVLQAGAMGLGGEIFILDMGKPVKIADLACDLITLSGLRPGKDIEIRYTGIRPGEKLFEELTADSEGADKTKHPKIFIGRIPEIAWEHALRRIDEVTTAAIQGDATSMRGALMQLIAECRVQTVGASESPASGSTKSAPAATRDESTEAAVS